MGEPFHPNEPAASGARQDERRGANGRFKPGHSGNPHGPAPGTKSRRAKLLDSILEADAERIIKHAIEAAMGPRGGPTLRCLVQLLLPPLQPRGTTAEIDLPTVRSVTDLDAAANATISAMATGDLTIPDAERIVALLGAAAKLKEISDLEPRLRAVEAALEKNNAA
jgi:hypothetical protein